MVRDEELAISKSPIDETTPDYAVEMCRTALNPKHPIFLYKFKDDKGIWKCYKFRLLRRLNSSPAFSTVCSGCSQVYKRECEGKQLSRKTDGRKMMSDPHSHHMHGCLPLNYDDVIRRLSPVSEEMKEKIIDGNGPLVLSDVADGDVNATVTDNLSMSSQIAANGTLKRNGSIAKEPESISSAAEPASGNVKTQQTDAEAVNDTAQSKELRPQGEEVAGRTVLSSNERKRKLPSSSNGQLADVVKAENYGTGTSNPTPLPILPSVPAERTPVKSVRILPLSPPFTFKKTFDAFVFNENEVEVSVEDGTLLRVRFEKKLLSATDSRSSLLHELPLPDSIDIESLSISWENGTIVVRARSKSL